MDEPIKTEQGERVLVYTQFNKDSQTYAFSTFRAFIYASKMHDMHPWKMHDMHPSPPKGGEVKTLEKKSVGDGQF